jgi:fatty-acyl-CoA synthase
MTQPDAMHDGSTMGDLIISALERHQGRVAFKDGGRRFTYQEVARRISQAAQQLDAMGLRRGDTIAQLAGNRPEVFFLIAAVYLSGMRSVTLHGAGSFEDHTYIVGHAEASLLVVDGMNATRGRDIASRFGNSVKVACHGEESGLRDFWRESARFTPAPLAAVGDAEDVVRLAYTGGTTGLPKGVMLSNRALVTNTLLAMAGNDWPDEVRFLCPTPISHGAGSLVLPTLWKGGCFILQDGFDCDTFLDALDEHQATGTFLVPTMLYKLLDHPRTRSASTSSLRTLIYGAAPMTPTRIRQAMDVFGPVLVQCYGQTECPNTILTLTQLDHEAGSETRLSSAGKPYPGIRVRLLDEFDGEVVRGEVGEICVRGPLLMSGYWKDPVLTEEATRGGWLHTGDLAKQDEDGFFYIVDRKKDMIISGGFNVYPKEIENVLAACEAVAAVAVIGVPDSMWGEAVKAVVVLRANASDGCAAELMRVVREKKGPVNTPKTIDFVESLPLTALGKIDKKSLRARYWDGRTRSVN